MKYEGSFLPFFNYHNSVEITQIFISNLLVRVHT
jgi:hypothetical protein